MRDAGWYWCKLKLGDSWEPFQWLPSISKWKGGATFYNELYAIGDRIPNSKDGTMTTLSPELIAELKKTARQEHAADDEDDFNPNDSAGGNIDDAFWNGESYGQTVAARDLLEKLGIDWKV